LCVRAKRLCVTGKWFCVAGKCFCVTGKSYNGLNPLIFTSNLTGFYQSRHKVKTLRHPLSLSGKGLGIGVPKSGILHFQFRKGIASLSLSGKEPGIGVPHQEFSIFNSPFSIKRYRSSYL
jgi:hypothetical protein